VAEAYRKHIQSFVFRYEGKVVDVGCSIGVAMCDENLKSKEDLLARADFSCHVAKRAGRNQVHLYSERDAEQLVSLSTDMGWARRIKDAIDFDRFVLACQPVVDTRNGELWCHEVLLRMRDEDGGIVMPSGFLPAAERFGLMKEVDIWVVRNAIRTLAQRRERGEWVRFSINISANAIADDSVVGVVEDELRRHGLRPGMLIFEITENAAITNLENASRLLRRLRALGCQTALDDFGVGYSSFSYLKDLPVDCVKIDGSFVRGLESSTLNRVIVRSIHEVAHTMGKKTVAEFVESEAVLTALADLGIDYAQGFHIGEPALIGSERLVPAQVVNLDEHRER
jgi:EAL domain-containing protein (putative c-di-GMP-specific phosphodiesterase class I)